METNIRSNNRSAGDINGLIINEIRFMWELSRQ